VLQTRHIRRRGVITRGEYPSARFYLVFTFPFNARTARTSGQATELSLRFQERMRLRLTICLMHVHNYSLENSIAALDSFPCCTLLLYGIAFSNLLNAPRTIIRTIIRYFVVNSEITNHLPLKSNTNYTNMWDDESYGAENCYERSQ